MKNKKLKIIIVMPFILLFTACSTTEKMVNDQSTSTASKPLTSSQGLTDSGFYQANLSENLKVDAVVDTPEADSFSSFSVEEKQFDVTKVVHIFFNNEQVTSEQGDGQSRYTSGEAILDISNAGFFRFNTKLGQYINTVLINSSDKNEFTDQELSDFPQEKAMEQATAMMKELGITPCFPPQIYSLDANSLQNTQNQLFQDEDFMYYVDIGKIKAKDSWTKEDESYYMVFDVECNGLPISSESYSFKNSEVGVEGSRATILVSRSGIQSFEVDGVLYQELEKKQSEPIISVEKALEALKQKYEKIILNDELTVKHISLVYTPVITGGSPDKQTGEIIDKKMDLIPAWEFTIDKKYIKDKKEFADTFIVQINAATGEEIW